MTSSSIIFFSDPPYENGFIQETIDFVVAHDALADDGVLVLEHHKDEAFTMPPEWECIKEQKIWLHPCFIFCET